MARGRAGEQMHATSSSAEPSLRPSRMGQSSDHLVSETSLTSITPVRSRIVNVGMYGISYINKMTRLFPHIAQLPPQPARHHQPHPDPAQRRHHLPLLAQLQPSSMQHPSSSMPLPSSVRPCHRVSLADSHIGKNALKSPSCSVAECIPDEFPFRNIKTELAIPLPPPCSGTGSSTSTSTNDATGSWRWHVLRLDGVSCYRCVTKKRISRLTV